MTEVKNVGEVFTLLNGEEVNLSLSFGRLNLLKKLNHSLYEDFNKILYGKSDDILDLVTMVYVAYWCANYGKTENLYQQEDFYELVDFNASELSKVFTALTQPKKK